jgi:tetratricopeptide (TPR) repeat protein
MRTFLLSTVLACTITSSFVAQSNQVQNAFNYLKNKEYDKAKIAADLSAANASTSNGAKTWYYRGKIYKAIVEDKDVAVKNLDPAAEEKALESFITCLKLDKGNDIYKNEVKGLLVQSSYATFQKSKFLQSNKEYDKALVLLDLVDSSLPYDFDGGLKTNGITKETILLTKSKLYYSSGNKELAKESINKLIDLNYKDASIYNEMSKLSLADKDTVKALTYLEKGRTLMPENSELLNSEINIYLAQGKINVLKDKLTKAIELTPKNEALYCVLANIYNSSKDQDKAIESYKKSLEINPKYDIANYNLGVIYFTRGKEWMDKVNALPLKEEAKAKDYEAKAKVEFKSATEYLEKSYEVSPDKRTKQTLFQLFTRLGEPEKAAKYAKDKQ